MMSISYLQLSDQKAAQIIHKFCQPILIDGEIIKAIFVDKTKKQTLLHAGGSVDKSSISADMRLPHLYLHKAAGEFKKGTQVRVLCKKNAPDLIMDRFDYSQGVLYSVTLVEDQVDDKKGQRWQ